MKFKIKQVVATQAEVWSKCFSSLRLKAGAKGSKTELSHKL